MTAQHTRLKPASVLPLRPAGAAPDRQPAPVSAPPPDDHEKYSYVGRNLPYLTTGLVVSAACLLISQLRFEAPSPALWPFLAVTVTYLIYQVISLPVNFTGRGFESSTQRVPSRNTHVIGLARSPGVNKRVVHRPSTETRTMLT